MKKLFPLLLFALSLHGCKNAMQIRVTEPAQVSLPPNIKTVGVIYRSRIDEQNKKYDKVEKILSLEGENLDKDGAKAGIDGLTTELQKNARFTEVKDLKLVPVNAPGSGVFPSYMSWETVQKICTDNKVDALFSLEMFDTDSKVTYAAIPTNIQTPLGNIPGVQHQANMITTVKMGWRIYDPAGKNLVDEFVVNRNLNFSANGINPVAAASALLGRKEAVKQVATNAGVNYALRIIPYQIWVGRRYFVRGHPSFKVAKRRARSGDWDGAGELWKKQTTNNSRKVAGRACYNMAIINEINGDLPNAIAWAQKAYADYNIRYARKYLPILRYRMARNNRLQQQNEDAK